MKKKYLAALLTAGIVLLGSAVLPVKAAQADENTGSYWSTSNAPVIYGASGITIPRGTEFDVEDPRFRVFARDFEDGDLTQGLTVEGEVDASAAGSYSLTYTVTDSDENQSRLEVPVTVTEEENGDITVQRIMYTTPSVWNMDLIGVQRNNYGDRQHLGIFMPADSSIEMRILDGTSNLRVSCYNDDRFKETEKTVPNDGTWVEISNVVEETSGEGEEATAQRVGYDCIPLAVTPVMGRGVELDKTFTIEVRYGSDVKALNYYVYGDDEAAFRSRWNQEQDSFGIIENEVMTLVIPYPDLARTTNYFRETKGFATLDAYLDYYKRVVNKMDEILGLSFDPEDPLDQNVRTRYVVKVNVNGWGMAYYYPAPFGHVGYNYYGQEEGYSMANFFSIDWCGLHEFAHGYQGTMGGAGGNMGIGEVGNNILCYYIQNNREIYTCEENWLGAIPANEERFNRSRLETGEWSGSPDVQLYMIINLLDHFERETTYRKMFQWYRRQLNSGRRIAQTDVYAEALADIYQVNVIPYLEAWGLEVGEEARDQIYERKLPAINILGDMVSESTLADIMAANHIAEKFEIVSGEVLKEVSGDCTIHIMIDSMDSIKGKKARILDGNTLVREVVVNEAAVVIEDLPVGTYTLQMPVSGIHSNDGEYLTVKEGGSQQTVLYTRLDDITFYNALAIKLQGIFNTYGCELQFDADFTTASVKLGGASMGSTEPYIKIYNTAGAEVCAETIVHTGNPYYFDHQKASYDVALEPGYRIQVHHPNSAKVKVFSTLTEEIAEAFQADGATTDYIVIEGGLRKASMTEEQAEEALYDILKEVLESTIHAYQDTATQEEIDDPYANRAAKEDVLVAYRHLKEEDQEAYRELIDKLEDKVDSTQGDGTDSTGDSTQGDGTDSIGDGTQGDGTDSAGDGTQGDGFGGILGEDADLIQKKWPFTDVAVQKGQWKYESVKYVYDHSIMNGISGTTLFQPDSPLTRSMFATVLYRMAGQPAVAFTDKFKDVVPGKWYSDAVIWANSKGIVAGYTDGNYGIDDYITREQIAKMLCEYARVSKYDLSGIKELSSFTDADKVSSWADGYMKWAVGVGMITGKPNGDGSYRLDPKGQATRAECAKMLMMFSEKYGG